MLNTINHSRIFKGQRRLAHKRSCIYFLADPRNPLKGYVGYTNQPSERLRAHLADRSRTCKVNWIKFLNESNLNPVPIVMLFCSFAQAPVLERVTILRMRRLGYDLVNGTDGGDGGATMLGKSLPIEQRQKIASSLMGHKVTDETRKRMSMNHRSKHGFPHPCLGKHFLTDEGRKRIAESSRRRVVSQETRLKMSLAHKGRKHGSVSDETKRRISESKRMAKLPAWNKGKRTGLVPWNKGKRLPGWLCQKMSLAHKRTPSASGHAEVAEQ